MRSALPWAQLRQFGAPPHDADVAPHHHVEGVAGLALFEHHLVLFQMDHLGRGRAVPYSFPFGETRALRR
jgi:hypothetical protein